jgi:ubiquinone/menaquinone biosynthesis C-methylase UbiE
LDIGCGNGNMFPTYAKLLSGHGVIVGMDQSSELLVRANELPMPVPQILLPADMNKPLPFMAGTFNWVISSFAIYYVKESLEVLNEISRVLRPGGKLVLIGPCQHNARELHAFNEKLFGVKAHDKSSVRTRRLEEEFYPAMKGIFQDVKKQNLEIKIAFPSREEFVKYYLATLLFEEAVKETGRTPGMEDLKKVPMENFDVSKAVVVIEGTRKS